MTNKQIEIVLTEEDIDILADIVDDEDSEPVTWTYDGVDITFIGHDWKVKQLLGAVAGLKEYMRVAGTDKENILALQTLEDELADLGVI